MKQALPTQPVPRETEDRLRDYVTLLLRWTARINLVAERDAEVIWERHVLDSLQLAPLLREGLLVDLGSGAGFPGLVLAAVTGWPAHLVESDRRKAAFLSEAARLLRLNAVTVHARRLEEVELPPADTLTARALAPLPTLVGHAARLLAPGGIAVFPKGRTAEAELTEAARRWTFRVQRFESRTARDSTILRLTDIHPSGADG